MRFTAFRVWRQNNSRPDKRSSCWYVCLILLMLMLRPVFRRPVSGIGVVRREACEDGFVVRGLFIHIFRRGFCFRYALIGLRALLCDDRVPRPQVFRRFLQQAQAAVFLNVLDGRAAALQALDALHPVDGFLVEYTSVAAIQLAGQRQAEHAWEKKYGVAHMAYAPLGQGRANKMFAEPIVQALAEKYGKTPAQILLRRTVQDGVTVIPKSIHAERIAENIRVFDFNLTEDEMSSLRSLDKTAPMIGKPETPELVESAMKW